MHSKTDSNDSSGEIKKISFYIFNFTKSLMNLQKQELLQGNSLSPLTAFSFART